MPIIWHVAACYDRGVGLTYIDGVVRAPGRRGKGRRVRFLVDSGAVYSVLRGKDWRTLRLSPARQLDFVLADGTSLTRGVSECVFELEGQPIRNPVSGQEHRARIDLPHGFEYEIAEVGSATSRSTGNISLDLKDSYAQFARLHLNNKGVVRHRASA